MRVAEEREESRNLWTVSYRISKPFLVKSPACLGENHMGSSKNGNNSNIESRGNQIKGKGPLWAVGGRIQKEINLGSDFLSPTFGSPKTINFCTSPYYQHRIQANVVSLVSNNKVEKLELLQGKVENSTAMVDPLVENSSLEIHEHVERSNKRR